MAKVLAGVLPPAPVSERWICACIAAAWPGPSPVGEAPVGAVPPASGQAAPRAAALSFARNLPAAHSFL